MRGCSRTPIPRPSVGQVSLGSSYARPELQPWEIQICSDDSWCTRQIVLNSSFVGYQTYLIATTMTFWSLTILSPYLYCDAAPPDVNPPPCTQIIIGRSSPSLLPTGAHTFNVRQSSLVDCPGDSKKPVKYSEYTVSAPELYCMHEGPNQVPLMVSFRGFAETGGLKRRFPIGGSAYGMLPKKRTLVSFGKMAPCTVNKFVLTMRSSLCEACRPARGDPYTD
jgi:hypothetical protein